MIGAEHLRESGEGLFLVDADVDVPASVEVEGVRYQRFMNRILLPVPVELLTRRQLTVMNRLRQTLLEGGADKVNSAVKTRMVALLERLPSRDVAEWGCGYTSLSRQVGDRRYAAVDADPSVVAAQRAIGIECYDAVTELDGLPEGEFDVVLSVFVFHFSISPDQISAMGRLLRPGGLILANVYHRSAASRSILASAFEAFGIALQRRADPEQLCANNEYWAASASTSRERLEEVLSWLSP